MSFASVVVVNKNDRGLADTLAALEALASPVEFEVVVIDASGGKLDDIRQQFPKVRWFDFAPLPTKRYWIPEQRNMGIEKARGDIIVFTDASCVPAKDWLYALLKPIIEDGEQVVAGSTRSRGKASIHDKNQHFQKGKRYIHECPTINLAFRRELIEKIGGFDPRFDYGSDVDFSWRLADAGQRIRYQAAAIVAHDWGNATQNNKRAYLYGVARARLYKKHPKRLLQLPKNDPTAAIYPMFLLGLPLTFWFWPYPLLVLVPLIKNIRQQPLQVVQKHLVYAVGVLRELVRR